MSGNNGSETGSPRKGKTHLNGNRSKSSPVQRQTEPGQDFENRKNTNDEKLKSDIRDAIKELKD